MGEDRSLKASTPGHGSPCEGIIIFDSEARLAAEPVEDRLDLCDKRVLFLRPTEALFRRVSSSEEAS